MTTTLTQKQRDFLIDNVLMVNAPRYEWPEIWNAYVADPTNMTKLTAARTRLSNLFTYLLGMAEYQLC